MYRARTKRLVACVVFAATYVVSIAFATNANADQLLHDAVIGLDVIVSIYVLLFSPVALVALSCLFILDLRLNAALQIGLALLFAILAGIGLHAMFILHESSHTQAIAAGQELAVFIALLAALSFSFVFATNTANELARLSR